MSSRGATWRGRHEQKMYQKARSRQGQRNRKMERFDGYDVLADMPADKFQYFVRRCQGKVAHKSRGAAYAAKLQCERDYGREYSFYECPICGKWHLTTHPWKLDD